MRAVLLALAVLTLLTAACSGTEEGTITAEGDAAATADIADEGDTAAEDEGGADVEAAAGIDAAACTEAAETLNAVPLAMSEAMAGTGDFAALAAEAEAFTELADQVPAQYADSFQIVGDAFAEIAVTLGSLDLQPDEVPDAEAQAELQELSATLSSADFTAASSEVAAYFAAGCPQS